MGTPLLTLSFLLLLLLVQPTESGCVMYDVCREMNRVVAAPCPFEGWQATSRAKGEDPFAPGTPTRRKLEDLCPHLFQQDQPLCCSQKQAQGLIDRLAMFSGLFQRCSSCVDNFAKLWCDFTCSPQQDQFMKVLNTTDREIGEKEKNLKPYVTDVEYRVSSTFMNGTFQSCSKVQLSADKLAISVMCGNKGTCKLQDWLSFLGTRSIEQMVPININFVIVDDAHHKSTTTPHYLAQRFTPCHQAPRSDKAACPRTDCDSYPNEPVAITFPPEPAKGSQVLGIGPARAAIIFSVCFAIFTFLAVWYYRHKSDKEDATDVYSSPGRIHRTGAWIERTLEMKCERFGRFVARNPGQAIAAGVVLSLLSCTGMYWFSLTTDRMDIWSSPTSRARIEQSTFDQKFPPYQRIEQITFVSKGPPSNDILPGPIFDKAVIKEMIRVIEKVRNLQVELPSWSSNPNRVIGFDDLCHRPLGWPSDCMIMSLSNLFQNRLELLDVKVDAVQVALNNQPKTADPLVEDFDYDSAVDPEDIQAENLTEYPEGGPDSINSSGSQGSVEAHNITSTTGSAVAIPTITPSPETEHIGYKYHIVECLENPMSISTSAGLSCLGTYGGPIFPIMTLGNGNGLLSESRAATMTFTLNSVRDEVGLESAMLWESAFVNMMQNYVPVDADIRVSFSAERSIEDELTREASSDVYTVLLSMVTALLIIVKNLGIYRVVDNKLITMLVRTKLCCAVLGLTIMVVSTFCSVGIFSYFSMKPTKSAMVVLFFIVMCSGMNHIFLYVQTYQRCRDVYEDHEIFFGKICAQVMPTILLSVVSTSSCFFLSAWTEIPAVSCFASFAALALVLDFLLQSLIFLGFFSLDIRREKAGRAELLYIRVLDDIKESEGGDGSAVSMIKNYYAPFLMKTPVRVAVILIFSLTFLISLISTQYIRVGLDQSMAFAEESYLTQHFKYLDQYMNIGPPVYFVVNGEVDYHEMAVQNAFCTTAGCNEDSFGNVLKHAAKSDVGILDFAIFNWVDTYLEWLDRDSKCCRLNPNVQIHKASDIRNNFCPASKIIANDNCTACLMFDTYANAMKFSQTPLAYNRPSIDSFYKLLPLFADDVPNFDCIKGGRAAFKDAIHLNSRGRVGSSHFMAFHKKLRISESKDFISAMEGARSVASRLRQALNNTVDVFAYSMFYVYYEQYETIGESAASRIIFCVGVCYIVIGLLLGIDFWTATLGVLTIVSVVVHLLGIMVLWSIEFNAISVANLIMSFGMSIEFLVHILRVYCHSSHNNRIDRVKEALITAGSTLLTGLTVTVLSATGILAFAHSQIFKVFYFRMFFAATMLATVHGIVLMPVILSFGGPRRGNRRWIADHPVELGEKKKCPERDSLVEIPMDPIPNIDE